MDLEHGRKHRLDPYKEYGPGDFDLIDDGTLDTVIRLPEDAGEFRYSTEAAADYRNEDGWLDFDNFVLDVVMLDLDSDPELWDTREREDGAGPLEEERCRD